MVFEEYYQIVKEFQYSGSLSLTEDFDAVCAAQDALIDKLVEKGAVIAGWKIVNKDGVVILSPIFDFQVFDNTSEVIPHQSLLGTELEVCFQLMVPSKLDEVDSILAQLDPLAAVELIRPEIHLTNHSACDFYFNYGVFVSQKAISGELTFEGGKQGYCFTVELDPLVDSKKDIVKQGIQQCIQRGYGNKNYFFITGTLNGLVPAVESLGINRVTNQSHVMIQFDIA